MKSLICVTLATLTALVSAEHKITSVYPMDGSIAGGTRLSILGDGFDERGRSNTVYIGDSTKGVNCDPVPNECTPKRIVCITEPFSGRDKYPITVSHGNSVAKCSYSSGCTFQYEFAETPEVSGIYPEWTTASEEVTVTGQKFAQGDETVGAFDFTMHIGDEERCNLDANKVGWSAFSCGIESGVFAGSQRLNVQMGSHGNAMISPMTQLDVYPQITAIYPNSGSVLGGQEVTVTGTSFSRAIPENTVSIHGANCGVVRVDSDELVCVTDAHAHSATQADTWTVGAVTVDWWYNSIAKDYSVYNAVRSRMYNHPSGSATMDTFGAYDATLPFRVENYMLSRFTTHFVATQTGDHVFKIKGDDNFELWVGTDESEVAYKKTWQNDADPQYAARIAYSRYHATSWDKYSTQKSEPVALVAGNKYWMRVYVANGGGATGFRCNVTLPDGTMITNPTGSQISLRTQSAMPVQVTVRNVSALYSAECIGTRDSACNFNFDDAATPAISTVSPASITEGTSVVIAGSGFSAVKLENTVSIGMGACTITAASMTSLTCTAAKGLAAGKHKVRVHVTGKGAASGSNMVTVALTLAAGTNKGSKVTVTGSGFDSQINVVTTVSGVASTGVAVAPKATAANELVGTIADTASGTASVSATVDNVEFGHKTEAFTYKQNFERPGTYTKPKAPSHSPTTGSSRGGGTMHIIIPAMTFGAKTGITVTVGTNACAVAYAWGSRISCIIPAASAPGVQNVTVNAQGESIVVGTYSYAYYITSISPRNLSPKGANLVNLYYSINHGLSAKDVSIKFEGKECAQLAVQDTYFQCHLPNDLTKNTPTTPVLAEYTGATSGVLDHFHTTGSVSASSSGFKIPAGKQLITKQRFTRPFAFSAKVKMSESYEKNSQACVYMNAAVQEQSTSYEGYQGYGGYERSGSKFGLRRNGGWYSGSTTSDATYKSGSYQTWRMEVWKSHVKFFVDDNLIRTIENTEFKTGEVGFNHACQDITVDNLKIEDLRPRDLTVTIGGVAAIVNNGLLVVETPVLQSKMISTTSGKAGDQVSVTGDLFGKWHRSHQHLLVMSSATEQRTFRTKSLCSSRGWAADYDGGFIRCTISAAIPAGAYTLVPVGLEGAATNSFSFTVKPTVTKLTTTTSGSNGGLLMIEGGGFVVGALTITVGGTACPVTFTTATTIHCKVPANSKDGDQIIVVKQSGSSLSLPSNKWTYDSDLTPTVTEIAGPTVLNGRQELQLKGTNLGNGYAEVDGHRCQYSWANSGHFRCYFKNTAPNAGSRSITVLVTSKGFATVTPKLTVKNEISSISEAGSTSGNSIAINGMNFAPKSMTNVASADYSTGTTNNHWTIAGAQETTVQYTDCKSSTFQKMLGGYGTFNSRTQVTRTLSGLAVHTSTRVTATLAILDGWWSSETFSVSVDSHTKVYTSKDWVCNKDEEYACGRKYSDCVLNVDFTVPHTATTAKITFQGNNFFGRNDRSWGMSSYKIQTSSADTYVATVGGVACPITEITPYQIHCNAPALSDASTATVALTASGSAVGCADTAACQFAVSSTTSTPVISAVTLSSVANTAATGAISWSNFKDVSSNTAGIIRKTSGSNSWNAGSRSSDIWFADSGLEKVTFEMQSTSKTTIMFGLTSGNTDRSTYYGDIDFAFYVNSGNNIYVYEHGDWSRSLGACSKGTILEIILDYTQNVVVYAINGKHAFTSRMTIQWPLRADVSIHNVGTSVKATATLKNATVAKTPLVVSGLTLPADETTTITVDGVACPLIHSTVGHATCAFPGAIAVGDAKSVVIENSRGTSAAKAATVKPFLGAASASTGSVNGRHELTLKGGGFTSKPTVNFGTVAGTVTSFGYGWVKVLTPVHAAGDVSISAIVGTTTADCVSDASQSVVAETTFTCPQYTFTVDKTPSITSISPTTVKGGDVVTVTGTGFDEKSSASVWFGAASECKVTAHTETSVTCTVDSDAVAGSYTDAHVRFASVGASSSTSATVSLTATATAASGNLGGAVIEFTGTGFGTDSTALTVTTATGANVCTSTTVTGTSVKCTTAAGDISGAVTVAVNGATAAVNGVSAAASAVSTITAASTIPVAVGDLVTLTGTNLDKGTFSVTVGGSPCTSKTATATKLICSLAGPIPAGTSTVTATSSLTGVATSSASVTATVQVTDVSPRNALPGSDVTIQGSGFSAIPGRFKVYVGKDACVVKSSTGTTIVCTLPAQSKYVDSAVSVSVLDFYGGTTTSNAITYAHTHTTAAVVSSVLPTSGSKAGGDLLTIAGSNFNLSPQENKVTLGGVPCDVKSAAAGEIICQSRGKTPANAAIEVAIADTASTGSVNFTAALDCTDAVVSTGHGMETQALSSVSLEGGIRVAFQGTGFPEKAHSKMTVTVGGNTCTDIKSTTTAVSCVLPPARLTRSRFVTLSNSYPARPDGAQPVVITINDTVVTNTPAVTYAASATPMVNASSLTGSTLSITGSGFAGSGNVVTLNQVALNAKSSTCTITSESPTSITCTVAPASYGNHFVDVTVPNKGKASITRSCPTGEFLMCDGSCLADSQCSLAEWGVTGCQDMATLISGDTFCDSNGGTDRVNHPRQTDSENDFNINCPMYSCEGKDCDTTLSIGGHGGRVSTCRRNPDSFVVTIKPTISGWSSKRSSILGGKRLTITGNNFDSKAVIRIGNTGCTLISNTASQIVCETQAHAAGNGVMAALWQDGQEADCTYAVCGGFSFSDADTPTVTAWEPLSSKRLIVKDSVTITGTGFSTSKTNNYVTIAGLPCTVTSATSTKLVVDAPAAKQGTGYGTPLVRVVGSGYANAKSVSTRVYPNVKTLSVAFSSKMGGQTVTITGTGFHTDKSVINVKAGCYWKVLSSTVTEIVAETKYCTGTKTVRVYSNWYGSHATCAGTECDFEYTTDKMGTGTTAASASLVTFTGTLYGTGAADYEAKVGDTICPISSASGTVVTCTPPAMPAGEYAVTLNLKNYGFAEVEAKTLTYALTVSNLNPSSGSLGGGQSVTVTGTGFAATADDQVVKIGTTACKVTTISATSIVCTTGAAAAGLNSLNLHIVSTNVSFTAAAGQSYTYSAAMTPTITSVTPARGSTAGGTALTITGTGMDNTMVLSIQGVTCAQNGAESAATTATTYYCTTAASNTSLLAYAVRLATTSNGDAQVDALATYQYIDLWSRFTSWGGNPPPEKDDSAVISEGQMLLLDYSPPQYFLIIVMGHLMFDPEADITLEATYIMVNFGRFTVGTPEKPYTKKATIRLYGDRLVPEIPVHGSKVLALRHGALDMHGIKRQPTWTRLAATVDAETNQIKIKGPVDWVAGETIVVVSTDYKMEHHEKRIISAVSGAATAEVTLTLNEPLHYQHWGERQCFGTNNDVCVDEIAEVMLLDRNIVVEGDAESRTLGFGGTMFLMPMGETNDKHARLSYVEFRDVGQQYIVGRYPVHFHVTGSANNSYVNGTSVHESLNRAMSIHGVNNNTYVNNVAYDIQGHAFFIEDGSEQHNVIMNNAVAGVHSSTSNLNTDVTPANFWVVSPTNTLVGNAACGGAAYGFWISPFHPHSTGPTGSKSVCPASHQLTKFANNVAHSNKKYGLNIFPFWWPKAENCKFDGPDHQAIIENHLSYKNKIHGVTMAHSDLGEVGAVIVDSLTSADNGELHGDASAFWMDNKIKAENGTMGIRNSVLIALTNNQPHYRRATRRGINVCKHDNFFAKDITFVNYNKDHGSDNWALEPQAWASRKSFCFPWGWETVTSGLRFINSPNRINFRFDHHGTFDDMDGTLSGIAGSQTVVKTAIFDDVKCTPFVGPNGGITRKPAITCPNDYKVRSFEVSSFEEGAYIDIPWTIEGRMEEVLDVKHSYSIIAPVRRNISINWNHAFNPYKWWWSLRDRYMADDENILFHTYYKEPLHQVNATYKGVDKDTVSWVTTPPTGVAVGTNQPNQYIFQEDGTFHATLNRPAKKITVTAMACPKEGCPAPPAAPDALNKPCTSFDTITTWASGEVPAAQSAVHVTYEDSVCFDRADGQYDFGSLLLEGTVEITNAMCPSNGAGILVKVTSWIHMRGGRFRIGSKDAPLTACDVEIRFASVDYNNVAKHSLLPWTTRSFALENGQLEFFGKVPTTSSTNLVVTAAKGTNEIEVADATGWAAGDYIAISSTQKDKIFLKGIDHVQESEHAKITAVNGNKITISGTLAFAHEGHASTTTVNGQTFHRGGEVALLSRNVKITGGHAVDEEILYGAGWQLNVGCTPGNTRGCGTVDTESGWPMSKIKLGSLKLDGVQLKDIGQQAVRHAGIELDGLVSDEDGSAKGSFIKNCAIWKSWNDAVSIRDSTTNFTVADNVIYDVNGDSVRVAGTANHITGNLAMLGRMRRPDCDDAYFFNGAPADCRGAHFRISPGNEVRNNTATATLVAGFETDGDYCEEEHMWSGNKAHSVRDGLLVMDHPAEDDYNWPPRSSVTCRKVGGVSSYSVADQGVIVWYTVGSLEVTDVHVIDAAIGYSASMMTKENDNGTETLTSKISDSTFHGLWPGQSCREGHVFECKKSKMDAEPWCQAFYNKPTDAGVDHKIGPQGVLENIFVGPQYAARPKGEHKFRWIEPDSYSTVRGRAYVNNVHFDNFAGHNTECKTRTMAFGQNLWSNDTFHQHLFEKITWGAGVGEGGKHYARTMYGDAVNFKSDGKQAVWLNFDDGKFGAYWPDSPNKFWLTDVDGSFNGGANNANILGSQSLVRNHDFSNYGWFGQWGNEIKTRAGVIPECSAIAGSNSFSCTKKYMSVTIESLAEDTLTRRPGPVVLCKGDGMIAADGKPLCQGGEVDFVSGPVMKGKSQRALLERLTRYRFIAEVGGNYTLNFRGQPPTWMRMWTDDFQYLNKDLSDIGVTMNLRYFGLNAEARVGMYVDGKRQKVNFGTDFPWNMQPAQTWPAPTDKPGTHFHNKKRTQELAINTMYFNLRPNTYLDLKQEPIVIVNMEVSMPFDEFFNQKDTFAAAMANVLGIKADRIHFANIVPGTTRRRRAGAGSTALTIQVDADTDELNSAQAEGQTVSPHSMSAVVDAVSTLSANPESIATSSGNSKFTVTGVSSSLVTIDHIEPDVYVVNGTSYVLLNVSLPTGTDFNTTAVQESVFRHTLYSLITEDNTVNITQLEDISVGNVFLYKDGVIRFTLSYTYEAADMNVRIPKVLHDHFVGALPDSSYTVTSKKFYKNFGGAAEDVTIVHPAAPEEEDKTVLIVAIVIAVCLVFVLAGLTIALVIRRKKNAPIGKKTGHFEVQPLATSNIAGSPQFQDAFAPASQYDGEDLDESPAGSPTTGGQQHQSFQHTQFLQIPDLMEGDFTLDRDEDDDDEFLSAPGGRRVSAAGGRRASRTGPVTMNPVTTAPAQPARRGAVASSYAPPPLPQQEASQRYTAEDIDLDLI